MRRFWAMGVGALLLSGCSATSTADLTRLIHQPSDQQVQTALAGSAWAEAVALRTVRFSAASEGERVLSEPKITHHLSREMERMALAAPAAEAPFVLDVVVNQQIRPSGGEAVAVTVDVIYLVRDRKGGQIVFRRADAGTAIAQIRPDTSRLFSPVGVGGRLALGDARSDTGVEAELTMAATSALRRSLSDFVASLAFAKPQRRLGPCRRDCGDLPDRSAEPA